MNVVPLLPWLPSEVRMINDIYVELEIEVRENEARKVKQQTIDSHKMFELEYKDGKPVRFILLSGIAGSGKTTIVSKIATGWALQTPRSTSPLSNFTFLVALSMRELKGVPDLTEAIFDQILAKDTKLDRKSLTTYLSSHAEEVLVVLDGADEYDKEGSQLPSEGFIVDIIRNKILRGCTVIVTTRPHMVDKLCKLNPSFIHIETKGFLDEGVQEYIQQFFKSDESEDSDDSEFSEESGNSDRLYKYLETSGTLLSLARTPIMLLLMCLVWSDEQMLPETLTELFKEALLFILKRHFEKSLLPIPEDQELLENQLIDLLEALGTEAFDGLMLPGQKLVFEAGDFGNSEVVDKACKIGILFKEKIRSKLRAVERVTFFHKTFQEAIAGLYWARLVESNETLFKSYLSKVDENNALGLEYLMRFCCGGNVKAARALLRYVADTFNWQTESSDCTNSDDPFRSLWILMHFEARSDELHNIAGTVFNHEFRPVDMNCGNEFKTALRFLVECATSSNQSFLCNLRQVSIHIDGSKEDTYLLMNILRCSPNLTDIYIDLPRSHGVVLGAGLGEVLSRIQSLVKLGINANFSNWSAIFNQFSQSHAASLHTLVLERCSISCRDSIRFFRNQSNVCKLILRDVRLQDDKSPLKINAAEGIETRNLKVLSLIHCQCDSLVVDMLRLNRSYPNLDSLTLEVEDRYNPKGPNINHDLIINHVRTLLSTAPKLRIVELKEVHLPGNAFQCLAEQLTRVQNLEVLKIGFRPDLGLEYKNTLLNDFLPLLANLRVLEVSLEVSLYNTLPLSEDFLVEAVQVDPEEFLAVVQRACASPFMNELTLYNCVRAGSPCRKNVLQPVRTDVAKQPTQSSIQKLNVSRNILGPYTAAFIRLLKQMPFLKKLNMFNMRLAKSDWTDLVEVLKGCQQLQSLNLGKNFVESRDLEGVLRLIPSLSDLCWLSLPKVSGQPTQMVHDCFQCCQHEIDLKLNNVFHQSGIAALVKVVEQYDTE